jgi:peroxiredoxin
MAIQPGQLAPQFTLTSSELKEVSLSDFKGKKVIIHFFPLAFTGTCKQQLCTVRDTYDDPKIQILAISVDSPFTLAKFKEENSYQFTLLSDFNKAASMAYGAIYEQFYGLKGVSKRAAFVIDENQVVTYAEVLENADHLPDFRAIADIVK